MFTVMCRYVSIQTYHRCILQSFLYELEPEYILAFSYIN